MAELPPPPEGIVLAHFIVSDDVERSRRFYTEVLGGRVAFSGPGGLTYVALANSWIIINAGGSPTDDKPAVVLETPPDLNRVSSFLNIRVKDIEAVYAEWSARGAQFLTPPKQHQYEIRCYIRDPDGHLIEVGQTTDLEAAVTMFREAGPGDFEDILRLYRQLQPADPVLQDGSDAASFGQILRSPGLHLFVLEIDGAVVATTYLNVIPNLTRSASPYAVIENVVVDETFRGTGLGKQIMAGTLRAAWDAGCYKAMLLTGSRNPATHAFYRACSFSPDAKQAYLARPS